MGHGVRGGAAAARGLVDPIREAPALGGAGQRSAAAPADLHVYCINLARSRARRAFMKLQAERLGLVLHFVDAVDGARLDLAATPEYSATKRRARFGWDLEAAEVAAALSHRKALLAIRAAGHARAVIVEDDVTLLPDFKATVSALHRRRDLAFDIVRLYGARDRPGGLVTLLGRSHVVERPYRPMCGLQAYMVNAASIDRVIASFVPITMQVDVAMDRFWENGLTILRVRPFVVADSKLFDSDIGATGDRWRTERKPLLRLGLRLRRACDHVARTAHILRTF